MMSLVCVPNNWECMRWLEYGLAWHCLAGCGTDIPRLSLGV